MKQRLGVGPALVFAAAIAGCSAVGNARETTPDLVNAPCDDVRVAKGLAVLSCVQAVTTAEQALGWLHGPVSTALFTAGTPCPAGARCAFPRGGVWTNGIVVFTFWWGDPVRYDVTIDSFSGAPVAVPVDEDGNPISSKD